VSDLARPEKYFHIDARKSESLPIPFVMWGITSAVSSVVAA
jgi:hypothetical protein